MSDKGSSRAATASVAALSVAGAFLFLVRSHRKRTARSEQPKAAFVPEGCQKLVLEPNDIWSGLQTSLGLPVGTTTFFEGGDVTACEKYLREKFRAVVKANSWLAGWTENDYDTPVLIHPTEVSDDLADSMLQVCTEPLLLCGPTTVGKQTSRFCLPYGMSTVGKPHAEAPLVRLALMPCRLEDKTKSDKSADIAVVFFTSHVIGGAHTHYKLLSMLSIDQPAESLTAVRVPGVYERANDCLGQDARAWLRSSLNHLGSAICSLCFGREPQLYRLVVCPEKLAKLKASGSGKQFVSTNDILTSCLGCLVGAAVTQITVDLRQRPGFEAVEDNYVGNYETTVLLDYDAVKSPSAVRNTIMSINQRCTASDSVNMSEQHASVGGTGEGSEPLAVLPAWWKFPFTRHAKITNWVSVARDLVLPGCQQGAHFPAGDDPGKMNALVPYDIVIAFRLNKGQTGLAVISRLFSKEDYIRALPVVDLRHDFE